MRGHAFTGRSRRSEWEAQPPSSRAVTLKVVAADPAVLRASADNLRAIGACLHFPASRLSSRQELPADRTDDKSHHGHQDIQELLVHAEILRRERRR